MINLKEFNNAIIKREKLGRITFNFGYNYSENIFLTENLCFPPEIKLYFENYTPIEISNEKLNLVLLPKHEIKFIDDKFINFAIVNKNILICFDTTKYNSANEWDIINFSNKYIITKTISSFLSNKIWALIDRDRKIWNNEFY